MSDAIETPRDSAGQDKKERKRRMPALDLSWLRWLITLLPFILYGVLALKPDLVIYGWAGVGILGAVLSLYFAHILLFRLQCGLFELLAMTMVLGIFEGLMLSTPGVTRIALWLSPLVLAWILYGAVLGLSRARLLGATSTMAHVLHMAAGWLGLAWIPLGGLAVIAWFGGDMISGISPQMKSWTLPLLAPAVLGLALDVWLGIKTARRAKEILRTPEEAAGESALNAATVDAKP